MKTVLFLVALAVCRSLSAQTEPLRRALFVEHGYSVLRQDNHFDKILILAMANAEYSANPGTFNRLHFQHELNSEASDLQTMTKIAESASNYKFATGTKDVVGSLLEIGKLGTKSGAGLLALSLAGQITKLAPTVVENLAGPGKQLEAQYQRIGVVNLFNLMGRRALEDALNNSQANPEFKEMVNELLAPALGGVTIDSTIEEITAADPSLANSKALQQILQMIKQGSATEDGLIASVDKNNELIKSQMGPLALLFKELEDAKGKADEASRLADVRQQFEASIQNARAGLFLVQTFAHFISPRAADTLRVTGTALIDITDSIGSFAQHLQPSALIMSATVVGAVMNVLNFALQGPGELEIVLGELKQIREDIRDLRLETRESFRALDLKLDLLFERVDNGFGDLQALSEHGFQSMNIRLDELQSAVADVRDSIGLAESDLLRQRVEVFSYLSDLDKRRLNDDRRLCLDFRKEYPKQVMEFKTFQTCLAHFKAWSLDDSLDALANGGIDRPMNTGHDVALQLQLPFETNVGYLALLSAKNFGQPQLQAFKNIGNPVMWAIGASSYAQMVEDWPQHRSKLSRGSLENELLPRGRTFQRLTGAIATVNDRKLAAVPNVELFNNALQAYWTSSETFSSHLKRFIVETEKKESSQVPIDYWGSVNQSTMYFPAAGQAHACEAGWSDRGSQPRLQLTSNSFSKVPPAFVNAEQLGFGAISVCYSVAPIKEHQRFRIEISCQLNTKDQGAYPIYHRLYLSKILSQQDFDRGPAAYLVENWSTGESIESQLLNQFDTEGTLTLNPSSSIEPEVELILRDRGEALRHTVITELENTSSSLNRSVMELAAREMALAGILRLGFPLEVDTNDDLHRELFGPTGGALAAEAIGYLKSDTSHEGDTLMSLPKALDANIDLLSHTVRDLLGKSDPTTPGSLPMVSDTIHQLEIALAQMKQ